MSAVTKVVVEEDEVRADLASAGLFSIEELHAVFLESTQARSTCTSLDPVNLPGVYMSGVTVRALRRIGLPKGWRKKNFGGVSITISPDRKVGIVVATGTSGTGRKDGRPQTRSKKGKKLVAAIAAPGRQLSLMDEFGKEPDPEIYFALYRYRVFPGGRKRVYIEISKPHPDGVNKRGRVVGWTKRTIVPWLDIDNPGDGVGARVPDAAPVIDVDVARR